MTEYSYDEFIEVHEPQLLTSAVPEHLWPALFEKLKNANFDAGKSFQIIVEQNDDEEIQNYSVVALTDVAAADPNSIYLIDHAWTFRLGAARQALHEVPGLKERLMESFGIRADDLMDVDEMGSDYVGSESGDTKAKIPHASGSKEGEDHDSDHSSGPSSIPEIDERIIKEILKRLPQFMQTYTMKVRKNVVDDTDMPVWFLMDEFGLRITHSTDPNMRVIPFFYQFEHAAYSLLFPLKDIKAEEEVTRNYVAHASYYTHPDWYSVYRLPWEHVDLTNEPIKFSQKDDAYFLDGRIPDQIEGLKTGLGNDFGMLDVIKVYATDDQLLKNLRSVNFEIVDDPFAADVIWTREHFHDYASLAERSPNTLVNQFPYESSLTVKDLFAACVQACPEFEKSFDEEKLEWSWPSFLPATFNLNEELPSFVAYFQKRQQRGLDNSFIIKPFNLARGLDTFVTSSVDYAIRLAETGPKLACKYIHNPVLFRRPDSGRLVKFDLRYIVFVRSLEPLTVYLYEDFWPRCAINDYDLQSLDDNLSHLSVFNYTEKEKVLNIRAAEFITQLQKLHPNINWADVQKKVDQVIIDVLKIASRNKAPRSMVPNPQSRAIYGFDIMIKWNDDDQKDVEVMFLEANFIPDCARACEFYPDFADTVFQTLFLGGGANRARQIC